MTVSVLVADPHAVVRAGVRSLLRTAADLRVAGEAEDLDAVLRLLASRRPDVLLLDPALPGATATTVRALRAAHPTVAVLVFTEPDDPRRARAALHDGAAGVLAKTAPVPDLAVALRGVARGRRYVDPWLAGDLLDEPGEDPDHLTAADRRMLRMIALGHTNREIAAGEFLSLRTVEGHRASLLRRLDLRSRPKLVAYVLARGLVADEDVVA